MELNTRTENNIGFLETEGYINTEGGDAILAACNELVDEGVHHFVVNIEKSTVINSTGVLRLLEVAERAQELGGGVALCGVTATIAKTFEIMGLLVFANISASAEQAIQSLEDSE